LLLKRNELPCSWPHPPPKIRLKQGSQESRLSRVRAWSTCRTRSRTASRNFGATWITAGVALYGLAPGRSPRFWEAVSTGRTVAQLVEGNRRLDVFLPLGNEDRSRTGIEPLSSPVRTGFYMMPLGRFASAASLSAFRTGRGTSRPATSSSAAARANLSTVRLWCQCPALSSWARDSARGSARDSITSRNSEGDVVITVLLRNVMSAHRGPC
jgi:hypothetical protein